MKRILIVEDEGIIARDLQQTLRGMGYDVPEICSMGEAAIPAAERLRPDVVLMDIRLAGKMDGTEAARRIVAKQDVAIVFLTAYADDATLERATKAFPYGYLVKPYDETALRAAIETALRRREEDQRRQQLHNDVLDRLAEPVILLGPDGQVRYANAAAREAIPDWSRLDELLGGWQEPMQAAPRTIAGRRWRMTVQQTRDHWAIVLTPPTAPARAEAALAALEQRMLDLI